METLKEVTQDKKLGINGLITKTTDSFLILTEKKLYVPEKRIVLLDQVTEQESLFLSRVIK